MVRGETGWQRRLGELFFLEAEESKFASGSSITSTSTQSPNPTEIVNKTQKPQEKKRENGG